MQVVTCIGKTNSKLIKPTRSYGDETRERILRAAEKLFARDGFQGATTRDMLRDAVHTGMLRNTAYGTSGYSVDSYLKTIVAVFVEGLRKS